MADVEQRAETEAEKKGLSGKARKSYIGGVFNRIREAHARAVKPGRGKTFLSNLNRRNRQLARARYKEALRPHEEAVAALKAQRKHELAQLGAGKREPTNDELKRRILASDLKPIHHISTSEGIGEAMARGVNRDQLRFIYGQHQLSQALDQYPTSALRDEAKRLSLSAGGSREALIGRLAAQGAPQTAKPARDTFPARDRQIREAVKHGAPDFPPGVGQRLKQAPVASARLSVRAFTYHGTPGYLISGTDAIGRHVSIFARSKAEAERMRDDIKAGREAKFDSEQKGGGDGQR